jgi:sulfate adenylyltransferase subunit 1 (EFTu-like GTPase family)
VPDYSPVHLPGLAVTLTASGPLAGGDPVEVAGSGTVQKVAAAGSLRYVGVAAADAATGAAVTVIIDRVVHEGAADGPVNAGDQLAASARAGCQVTQLASAATATAADVNAARAVVGVALTGAADGATVRWVQR